MKKLNHKGHSLLHVLLLVGIVGMITGVGYYVHSSRSRDSKALDNAAKSQNTQTIDKTSWESFSSSKMGVSFRYPETLEVYDQSKNTFTSGAVTVEDPRIIVGPSINLKERGYSGVRRWLDLVIETYPADFVKEEVYTGLTNPSFIKIQHDQAILEVLTTNGRDYKLINYGDFAALAICESGDSCASAIKRSDGSYISFMIAASGEVDKPMPKFDSSNVDYVNLVEILKTLHF